MDHATLSRALVPLPQQERIVEAGFWRKVKRLLGRVPFLDQLIAAYYAAIDPLTPRAAKATLYAALAYFVMPADLIPDVFAAVGYTDDGAVLLIALQAIAPWIKDEHVARARRYLDDEAAAPAPPGSSQGA